MCKHSIIYRLENEENGGIGCPICRREEREAERDEFNRRVDAGDTPAEASDAVSGGRCVVCGGFHAHSWKQCARERAAFERDTLETMRDALAVLK